MDGGPVCHELVFFLLFCRYVDYLEESKAEKELCQELAANADQLFGLVGLKCKEWMFTGEKPPENVSKDGVHIKMG